MVAAKAASKDTGKADTKNNGVTLTASGKPKEKRRNNEKRKEKSRDAARCRRSRETEIFTDLAQVIPLQKEDVNQLDKASIMRIAIAYLKVRDMLQLFPQIQKLTNDSEDNDNSNLDVKEGDNFDLLKCAEASQLIKQTLEGFLLVLSNDGDITYVSDNITEYLGLAKIDMLGQQVWEYLHQCDHAELKEALNIKRNGIVAEKVKDENLQDQGISTEHRDLFVRFKCTITSRGRSINIKSASYKVMHLTGHLVLNAKGERVLVTIARPIPHPSNIEIPLGTTTFLTKHSLDMKFSYVDEKMFDLLGYESEDLLNKSLFECHHGSDAESLMSTFKTVWTKGQGESQRYRFLGKNGGYCWLVTQATIINDKLKPQSVVCVNYVISNLENGHEIYSLAQYEASQTSKIKTEDNNNNNKENNTTNNNNNNNIIKPNKINDVDVKPIITNTTVVNDKTNKNNNNNKSNNDNKPINKTITTPQQQQPIIIDNNPITIKTTTKPTTTTINHIKRLPTTTTTTTLNTPPTTTVTSKLLKANKTLSATTASPSSSSSPRPKSVTASVFRAVPGILPNICNKNNNKNNSTDNNNTTNNNHNNSTTPTTNFKNSLQLPTNVATSSRAQSVTASVFTPISQLNLKTKQQTINNNLKASTSTAAILAVQNQKQQQLQQKSPQKEQQQKDKEDMNKGFLSFAEDASNDLTMLKEEPDDPHLAPSANVVDACMPLDETVPLFGEMLVGLMGSYGSLLPDDINSLDSAASSTNDSPMITATTETVKSLSLRKENCNNNNNNNNNSNYNNNNNNNNSNINNNNNNANETRTSSSTTTSSLNSNNSNSSKGSASVAHIDPFINYREESNDTNCSQHLLSPSVTSTSPEASSLPSLCSPNSLSQEDEFAFMTMNVDDDIDLTMRAPYIPMNEQDDLPLLTADDLMWCSSNAFSTDDMQMQKDIADVMQQQFQQLQQIQAACENPHLRNNILDFNNSGDGLVQQQQQQTQQQQQQQLHLNNNFSNSLCSSPASTVSSLSPSPSVSNHLQQHQQQHGGSNLQQDTNSASVFGTDSSELAALLCGTGNGTLTILGSNSCNDESENSCNGIVGGNIDASNIIVGGGGVSVGGNRGNNNNNNCGTNTVGGGGNVVGINGCIETQHFRHQLIDEQLQRQQQQQLLGSLNIICKKEKFDANALASNLCDSIDDAFDTVYSKDSSNLDCWNDYLPINVTETTVATALGQVQSSTQLDLEYQNENCKQQHHPHQQVQQQELLLSAVPLITIQNNKNILLQQASSHHQQHELQGRIIINNNNNGNFNKLIVNDEMLSAATTPNNRNNNNKLATIKLLNGTTTGTTTMRLIDNKLQQQSQQQRNQTVTKTTIIQTIAATPQQLQQQQHQHGNKRHLNPNSMQFETKRLKSAEIQRATPQLLQQLMGNNMQQQQQPLTIKIEQQQMSKTQKPQQQQQQRNKLINQRWSNADDQQQQSAATVVVPTPQPQQQQQQSDSVLKNLLISGCDNLETPQHEPMYEDENSLDNGAPTSPCSISSISPNKPLRCSTSTASVLRNFRHNPMIGGPGILPSPTFSIHNEDSCSSLPELITANDVSETSSDSGIAECTLNANVTDANNTNVVGIEVEPINGQQQQQQPANGLLLMKSNKNNSIIKSNVPVPVDDGQMNDENQIKRKTSISFIDSSNPLLTTPFLMDLCNDDYNMNTDEFLEENEIDVVLDQWSNVLV